MQVRRFGNPGFIRFERGSLVAFQSLTLIEQETPLLPATVEEHLQNYINDSVGNTSFPFAGATVTVTDFDECQENTATCPYDSTCLNTPGGYGCTYCTPEVTIIGGGMSITRSRAFRLNSRFAVGANCTEPRDVMYKWEALPSTKTQWQDLAGIVLTKADLLVPSRTLEYGTYLLRLRVTVREKNTGVVVSSTSNSASVSITASSLIAGILGGFKRQVGTGSVTLDAATLSSDPDGVISRSKDLDYRWSCTSVAGVCPALSGSADGLLTVNLGLETLHSELTFTVEVSAPNRDNVTASQIIEVVRSTIPLTSIICDSTYGTCGPKINSGEKMRLSVLCSNCRADPNNYRYNWTLVQTQGVATTWTGEDWRTNILNDRTQDHISFRADVFNTQGTYTVTAIVTDSNTTESGSSEYSFTLNEPPTVGDCAVHPSNSSEGFFELQCRGFSDPDLPLRYDFEYTAADVTVASVNSTATINQHLLYSGPAPSTPPIRLPTGDPDENYELEIVIRVTDDLGAFSVATFTTNVRPPEEVDEFVDTVLDDVDVDDVQQTTSSIASAASVLNVANKTDVENTTRTEARDRMVDILEQVQVLDVQQVKQVSGTLEHVTNKPEELSDESQVKAADTLKMLGDVLTDKSSEVGTEELERIAAHLVTGAVNVLEASSESAEKEREEAQVQNRTREFEKNQQATTTAFETIDNLALTMISRKNRDEKPTLVQAKEFLMSLARSSCDGLGTRVIQTQEDTRAYFQIPENTTTKLCVNGTVGSQTYFTPQNPFEYANNARDVRTAVLGLSLLGGGRKVLVSNLEKDERIESINPVVNRARMVNGTATSSNSGQISLHNFNTTEPGVAFYVRVNVTGDDANVTLRVYLKRGAVVSPDDYSHNVTLTGTGYTSGGRTMSSMQPFAWFLNQTALNISNQQEMWAIGIQRVPTVDENGQTSDSNVPYTISITPSKCIFFNETTRLWTDNGCEVGPQTTDEQLHCICDHLTAFAGFVAPNPLDLGSSFTFDLDISLIALVTVCVVIALYIVAVFIGRSLDLADERKRQKKAHRQLSKTTKGRGFLSHHLWVSVVRFPSNHFTRVQRISCCLSLLMSFMLVNIMFYRGDRNFLSKVTIGGIELEVPFSLTTFIIGLESSLIALPINVFIVVLFRYAGTRQKSSATKEASKPKEKANYSIPGKGQHGPELVLPRYLPKAEDAESEFDAEYTADPSAYIDKLKKEGALKKVDTRYVVKKEGSKVTVSQKPYRPFPWWCRIVAWFLVAAIVIVSGAFTVLYGNDYGRAKSQAWLLAFLISFLTDFILLQPVKIILVIIFFKLVTKDTTFGNNH
ncbi:sperm receptor for egg jelly-like [Branchiostoma floridae x Branchiostoma japonicum]